MTKVVDCQSTLIANFGMPVWENPTEFMMEAVFKHEGMKYRYISTEVPADKLEAAFEGVKAMGYKGFNCTLPHKQKIIPLLDGLGESAELMGAVNCVVERNGQYIGENTDGKGYTESLKEITEIAGKTLLILGAGGAARAIAVECALENAAKIIIVNRTPSSGQELAELVDTKTGASGEFIPLEGELKIPEGVGSAGHGTRWNHCVDLHLHATRVFHLIQFCNGGFHRLCLIFFGSRFLNINKRKV